MVRKILIVLILLMVIAEASRATLQLQTVVEGLDRVTFVGHAYDNRLFIAQQTGEILIFSDGALLPTPFLDVSSLVNNGFERGLLSFAFHPDYASNGFVFVFYSNLSNHATVARYQVSAANPNAVDPASATVIYGVDEGSGHYGGQLGFGSDGYLYFSIGDGGSQNDPECDAQNPANVLGSILRIDVDQNINTKPFYGIPVDNPFVGMGGMPAEEVWSYGFRNPWRFSFDRMTGDFYFSDVGQNTREEFNFEASDSTGGLNYGWKAMEGTFCHDNNMPPSNCPVNTPVCDSLDLTPPAFEYQRSAGNCSITGGYVYRGSIATQVYGRYLYGDWCSGNIWAAAENAGIWSSDLLPINLPSVTTFGEDDSGEVYLSNGSVVYQITDTDRIFANGFD
ncbi:PQQ-dependent sugar dehydrogenase [Marinicella sp. W31]|uniref:PQQ-dependent sugar dehydrogenase n=1 Tax=Marinicella sp. W31 TaxID=3023713 RepID=UPI003756D48A